MIDPCLRAPIQKMFKGGRERDWQRLGDKMTEYNCEVGKMRR